MSGLLWRLATALAVLASFFAIWDNGNRVERLEMQVCDTVYESSERARALAYYREHPVELRAVLRDNRAVLMRFHCPIEKG